MTTVAVLADPPRPGLVLPRMSETAPLSSAEAADLYVAMLRDVTRAVERSGGDLLVNYRPEDALPAAHRVETSDGGADAETEIRAAVEPALDEPDAARFEVQVGETFAGRAGNTATHLLDREGVTSVAVVEPTATFLGRTHVDGAAMKLRRSEVVLGPADRGRVYYAGFTDTVDFSDAYAPPAVGTLAARARDAGHDVDFVEMLPVVETGPDLASALALVDARRTADRRVPQQFGATCDEFGLAVEYDGSDPRVVR